MKNIKNDILFSDLYINKEAYDALKIFYRIIEKKWDFNSTEIMSSIVKNNIKLKGYLKSNNFAKTLGQIQKNSINKKQLLDQFHRWFDNLKIYKFLKLYGD
jgi:bacterioferritin (cytochrome b1)